ASIRGTVYDPNGAALPGAQIKLTNLGTAESRSTVAGEEGEYALSSLRPGSYRIEIAAQGFATLPDEFELKVNQEMRIDAHLEVSGSDPFELFVANDEKKKDSASLGTVIENRQVEGLPLDGRNFYELTLLVPGAVPAAQGSAGSARGDFAFSVNGAREDS